MNYDSKPYYIFVQRHPRASSNAVSAWILALMTSDVTWPWQPGLARAVEYQHFLYSTMHQSHSCITKQRLIKWGYCPLETFILHTFWFVSLSASHVSGIKSILAKYIHTIYLAPKYFFFLISSLNHGYQDLTDNLVTDYE